MVKKETSTEVMHELPPDMKKVLSSDKALLDKWNNLTPLGRNEWICWTTIVKTVETRKNHLVRLSEDLLKGKRRPCCWPGCPHRNEKAKKWFEKKK